MLAIFEKYSQTSDAPKSKIRPINLKIGRASALKKILTFLEAEEYDEITLNKDFYEIYFCDRDFEITLSLFDEGGFGTTINISVYHENRRGLTRGKLKEIRKILSSLFIEVE